MKNQLSDNILQEYINGVRKFPKDVGFLDIKSQKTDSKLSYYNWELSFKHDIEAQKKGNECEDEVQIIFNLNQKIKWIVGSDPIKDDLYQIVTMDKGEVCIYRNNNMVTSMSYKGDTEFRFKSLQMPTHRFDEVLERYFKGDKLTETKEMIYGSVNKTVITADMYKTLSEIDSADRYKEYKGIFLEGKMIELMAMVLYGIVYNQEEKKYNISVIDAQDVKKIEALREKIQLKPADHYNSEVIAGELSMSVSKLNRLFRSIYGTSLHAYIQDIRIEYAANLLLKEGCNVTEAAVRAGYNNMSYFSRVFSEKYGTTPKRFSKIEVNGIMSEKC